MMWTASSAQRLVIEGDTLYCYKDAEIRQIAKWRVELDGCINELRIDHEEITDLRAVIAKQKEAEAILLAEKEISQTMFESYQSEIINLREAVKVERRKRNGILVGAGAVVGMIFITTLK